MKKKKVTGDQVGGRRISSTGRKTGPWGGEGESKMQDRSVKQKKGYNRDAGVEGLRTKRKLGKNAK